MNMNFWELALLAGAAYVAITTLVHLMGRQRDTLIDELTREAEAEKQRLRAEERNEKRRKMREQIKQEQAQKAKSRRAA